jgi:CRISPR/Cas system CSM-associated protein Csm3 (group 7 of RAMP superfamily)
MKITYQVKFYSDWHCGSGLAAGADVDALVIKDKNKLPYIPGKTIKGLIKEAVDDLFSFRKESMKPSDVEDKQKLLNKSFGYIIDKDNTRQGLMFFSNANIPSKIAQAIVDRKQQEFLYRSVSSTSIENNGIAKNHSLRRIETTVPCQLEGSIEGIPEELKEDITDALKYIKRLGMNRNRGLGRCCFTIIEEEKK